MLEQYGLSAESRAFLETANFMWIDGEPVQAAAGQTFEAFDPASGQPIAALPAAQAEDVDRAVASARAAFDNPAWRMMRPNQRERLIHRLADLIEANAPQLAELEALNNGKGVKIARYGDVASAVNYLRYMAGWPTKLEGQTMEPSVPYMPDANLFGYTRREPVGVVGAIIPWNFPLVMAAWKLGPALAAGCTVVLKPAEETPLTALRLAQLVQEAGFPPGVVNVVTGLGDQAGAALAAHPGVNKITFTGSTEVGKLVGKAAIDNMARLSLELGGKSPVIVLPDADIKAAVRGAANAIFFNQGQVCTAGSRLYVHRSIFDQVAEGVASIADKMVLGDAFNDATQMGPLVSARQQQRVLGYIEQGLRQGAEALAGGGAAERDGYFVKPTVLSQVNDQMSVVQQEIFGPVLVADSFSDLDEVLARANGTQYGLGASLWSNDLKAVHYMIPRIQAGTVWVNTHNVLDPALPFGGYKQSGIGREMARQAVESFTETKAVLMNL
ncbi:aldehyde dehydrogenase family protein [Marinobacterium arenosum]|uniref:aldehyde dehydrogenase family protein n=1 Tax=Marinobacterium arenosum TaxID=2862496 RepID=UPI001C9568AF|nr:aldehyde dehydrogenase family protein [Marinobacterium arenosum]MBY4677684.1 aldehyde dehydrogenase family protein [Marinobacterium arenosum]